MTTLDTTGLLCPLPVIELARAASRSERGELITVVADDPATLSDIPAWCAMKQKELLSTDTESGSGEAVRFVFVVRV